MSSIGQPPPAGPMACWQLGSRVHAWVHKHTSIDPETSRFEIPIRATSGARLALTWVGQIPDIVIGCGPSAANAFSGVRPGALPCLGAAAATRWNALDSVAPLALVGIELARCFTGVFKGIVVAVGALLGVIASPRSIAHDIWRLKWEAQLPGVMRKHEAVAHAAQGELDFHKLNENIRGRLAAEKADTLAALDILGSDSRLAAVRLKVENTCRTLDDAHLTIETKIVDILQTAMLDVQNRWRPTEQCYSRSHANIHLLLSHLVKVETSLRLFPYQSEVQVSRSVAIEQRVSELRNVMEPWLVAARKEASAVVKPQIMLEIRDRARLGASFAWAAVRSVLDDSSKLFEFDDKVDIADEVRRCIGAT